MSDRMERVTVRHCNRCDKDLVNDRGGCEGAQHGNKGCAMNNPITSPTLPRLRYCDECPGEDGEIAVWDSTTQRSYWARIIDFSTADSADVVQLPGESRQHAIERLAWEKHGPLADSADARPCGCRGNTVCDVCQRVTGSEIDKAVSEELREENDKLRGLLAWGSDPCIYCGLRASEMSQCRSGFPGCARADDMMCAPDKEGWTRAADQQGAAHE